MRALITGATGFIGSWTADACLRRNMKLAALTVPGQEQYVLDRWHGAVLPLIGTLSSPPWNAIQEFAPDACLHTAWVTTPGEYLDNLVNEDFLKWSTEFFARLIELRIPHIVGIGSCAEYTLTEIRSPVEDDVESSDESLYARCKNKLRIYLERMAENTVTQWAWARLFYPYGPGEASDRLCSAAIRTWLSGDCFMLKCPYAKKDYIFVSDVADGLACILQNGGKGVFDVGTGEAIAIKHILEELAMQMGSQDLLVFGEAVDRLGTLQANPEPLQALGWRASISHKSGLKELVTAAR